MSEPFGIKSLYRMIENAKRNLPPEMYCWRKNEKALRHEIAEMIGEKAAQDFPITFFEDE